MISYEENEVWEVRLLVFGGYLELRRDSLRGTLSITTLSILTFSILAPSIKVLFETLSINYTQQKQRSAIMLSVIKQNVASYLLLC